MNKKVMRSIYGVVVILLFLIASSEISFADDNTFVIDNVEGSIQNEVMINGEANVIYCMQQNYLWPVYNTPGYANPPTKYRPSTDSESLLTTRQQESFLLILMAAILGIAISLRTHISR